MVGALWGEMEALKGRAAETPGTGCQSVYGYRRTDRQFADRCARTLGAPADNLGFEAVRKVDDGDKEPVCVEGKGVGHKNGKSDSLR